MKVYLAGPEVFLPDAAAIGAEKKRLCRQYGFEGLYPLDEDAAAMPGEGRDAAIYRACVAGIHRADLAIFNLTPFRGVGADPGTVFELGLCVGLGKPVFAYTNDARDLIERAREIAGPLRQDAASSVWSDAHGLVVEDFGNADNLMIDCALRAQGRVLHRHPTADAQRDMIGFVACLMEAQGALATMN